MANEKMPENVNIAIKTVLRETVTKEQQKAFDTLRKDCKLFLERIDRIIIKYTETGQLINRVQFLGQLFHGENSNQTQIADLVLIGHNFEKALNKYFGREVPITIVQKEGDIDILSEKTTTQMYRRATEALSGNRGYISNYQDDVMHNRLGKPALIKLQKEIDKSVENRKAVFSQALDRWKNSSDMDYAQKPENKGFVPNLYWIINSAHRKHWTQKKISKSGYIGQGYVALALKTETIPSKLITYQHNPLEYDKEAQRQIELLSEEAQKGDSIPGILQGDVHAEASGNIQLAIKQATRKNRNDSSFQTAGISINFAIAYAILHYPQEQLIMPQDLQESLESIVENISGKWQLVYKVLINQAERTATDIKDNLEINIFRA